MMMMYENWQSEFIQVVGVNLGIRKFVPSVEKCQLCTSAAVRVVSGARRHDHITPVLTTFLASSAQESNVQDCGFGVEVS